MNVLLVEDERRLAGFLETALRNNGFAVSPCRDIEELRAACASRSFRPDIVVLDRLLGGEDALAELPRIRKDFPAAKILILSALTTPSEKARGLDQGADDYLAKPFSSVELLARLRALGRRANAMKPYLSVGNLVLDTLSRVASVGERRLQLSGKELGLLQTLMSLPGKIFSKTELLERLWDVSADVESNVIEATVNNLRRKLEVSGANVAIRNTRNVGYWIEA